METWILLFIGGMMPRFKKNFYVRYYYRSNTEIARTVGQGPHYEGFDTDEEARYYILDILTDNNDVYQEDIDILSKFQMNRSG